MIPKRHFYQVQAETIIKKLEQRNIYGYYVATGEEAKEKVLSIIPKNSSVAFGGSQTLKEIGLVDAITPTDYILPEDPNAKTPEERRASCLKELDTDYYLMSTNAITLDGHLVNIDGSGNRVAALIYGPRNVIIVAGMNKVVGDIDAAIDRVHNMAAPPNAIRLSKKTPCAETGKCHNCLSEDCICCQTVITRNSKIPGRIKVILVGEELGF